MCPLKAGRSRSPAPGERPGARPSRSSSRTSWGSESHPPVTRAGNQGREGQRRRRDPHLARGRSRVFSPRLTHLGGATGPGGGEWGRARPAGERLGSGASPAHTSRTPRRAHPDTDAGPGNCRSPELTFAPTARTRSPLPAEVTSYCSRGNKPELSKVVVGSQNGPLLSRFWGWGKTWGGCLGI